MSEKNKPEIKKDCFGWNNTTNNCKVCTEVICKYRRCTHYKTKEQYLKDCKKYPFIQF